MQGPCDGKYELVREEFERNFAERGELGASLCITADGQIVVDLVGGIADPEGPRPWTADTLVMVWSCTKGALAFCVHALASMGLVELDRPAAYYWPGFRAQGKAEITVAMLLNHQAGLPGVPDRLPPGTVFDWEEMIARLERVPPWWTPGACHGYHAFTFGWLNGEIVRRVTGLLPGEFFRQCIAEPAGLDFWIGLPEQEDRRVARVLLAAPPEHPPLPPFHAGLARKDSIQSAVKNSFGEFDEPDVCQQRDARAANVPAVNGVTNARGLALLYMPLATGARLGGVEFDRRALRRMASVESASSLDAVTGQASRFSSGFMKAFPRTNRWDRFDIPEEAFGHTGFGGSVSFADPARRLSMGYTMNRHASAGDSQRFQSLIDALYRCVDPSALG